jgi:hypothetical protein
MCERGSDPRAALGHALDALDGVDATALADDELHELAVALQAEASRFASVRARVLSAWERRRAWADDGSRSAASRLAGDADLSPETAGRELKRARKLASMPATAEALRTGKLSLDKVQLLCWANHPRLATFFRRDEAMLVDSMVGLRYADAERLIKYWRSVAEDAADKPPTDRRYDGRHLDAVRTWGDTVDLRGRLDPLGGAEFLSELKRLEDELFKQDWAAAKAIYGEGTRAELLTRTPTQRRADALAEMARRSRAMPPGAQRPRPLITVLTGEASFARLCELASGVVLSPGELVPVLAGADVERIVFDGPSRVIDVGEARFFRGALRRAIEVRDRHCQHRSGCDVPAERCEVDHVVPASEGGPTTQENGRLLCGFHNRRRNERPPP